jgi:hypothetical protein
LQVFVIRFRMVERSRFQTFAARLLPVRRPNVWSCMAVERRDQGPRWKPVGAGLGAKGLRGR